MDRELGVEGGPGSVPHSMSTIAKTLKSSIGAKTVMALSGFALLGFVVAHLLGNLQIFAGQEKINAYAQGLKDLGPLLWVARIGLIVVFLAHVGSAGRLVSMNRAARPVKYVSKVNQRTSFAARTMWVSGLLVLLFVGYHVAHYTLLVGNADWADMHDSAGRHDVAKMVTVGFRSPLVSLIYVAAQVLLFFHLSHGLKSAFQSLGLRHPRLAFVERGFAPAVAGLIAAGNIAIPVAILAGYVPKGVTL